MNSVPGDAGLDRRAAEAAAVSMPLSFPRWKPGIWVFVRSGEPVLVKDVRGTHPLFRFTLGRWGLRRERKLYGRLQGFPRVPRFLGRLDADALLFEKLDAEPFHRADLARLAPDFFERLQSWIEALHREGIVHLDLRQKRNILIGSDGEPYVVDFGAALYLGKGAFARRALLPLFAWIDRSAVSKLLVRYLPERAGEEDRRRDRRMNRWRRLWVFSPHKVRR